MGDREREDELLLLLLRLDTGDLCRAERSSWDCSRTRLLSDDGWYLLFEPVSSLRFRCLIPSSEELESELRWRVLVLVSLDDLRSAFANSLDDCLCFLICDAVFSEPSPEADL